MLKFLGGKDCLGVSVLISDKGYTSLETSLSGNGFLKGGELGQLPPRPAAPKNLP